MVKNVSAYCMVKQRNESGMRNTRSVGIFYVFLSAVVFGFTPILANLSYAGGNNGVNMAFLRAVIPLPVLMAAARATSPGYRATARQWRMGVVLGCLQFSCTLMLYSSYSYIPVGIATTLHFLYPLFVVLYHVVRFRQRPGRVKLAGLLMGVSGVILLVETGAGGLSPVGMGLALLSGVVFAAYIIVLQREAAQPLPLYRLMTVTSLTGAVLCAAAGLCMGCLTLVMTPQAWLFVALTALLASIGGSAVFQAGVRIVGDADAAVYSLLEPLTSIVFGLMLLGEAFTLRKGISCGLILAGLFVTAMADRRQSRAAHSA